MLRSTIRETLLELPNSTAARVGAIVTVPSAVVGAAGVERVVATAIAIVVVPTSPMSAFTDLLSRSLLRGKRGSSNADLWRWAERIAADWRTEWRTTVGGA
jgi:hypothetical protein